MGCYSELTLCGKHFPTPLPSESLILTSKRKGGPGPMAQHGLGWSYSVELFIPGYTTGTMNHSPAILSAEISGPKRTR